MTMKTANKVLDLLDEKDELEDPDPIKLAAEAFLKECEKEDDKKTKSEEDLEDPKRVVIPNDGINFFYPGQELKDKIPVLNRKSRNWFMIPFSLYLIFMIIVCST